MKLRDDDAFWREQLDRAKNHSKTLTSKLDEAIKRHMSELKAILRGELMPSVKYEYKLKKLGLWCS